MRVDTIVIGAGHAGLAVSSELSARSIDHVVLERGEVANSWRHERWDSLRLLTPHWQSRLPGFEYRGSDPDGFMTMPEVVEFISGYSKAVSAPIETKTTVTRVGHHDGTYTVETDQGTWSASSVVIASGAFNKAKVPETASALPASIESLTPLSYKRPDELAEGAVLVVGVSASGVQIADELVRSGRDVALAVGEHVRMPRVYRGKDIQWWMDRSGLLDERYDEVDDIVRARHVPSPQLVGTPGRETLDLNSLTTRGARLYGRIGDIRDGVASFSGSLRNVCNLADLKQIRLLDNIDEWARESGFAGEVDEPERYAATHVPETPELTLDLEAAGVTSVIWATGYRPDYSWLDVPVLDRKGEVRHDGGVIGDSPGLYRIGLNFLRRRKSSFIHGAGDDAADIVSHLSGYLNSVAPSTLAAR